MNRKLTQKSESPQKKSASIMGSAYFYWIIPVILSFILLMPALQNGFVNWDDNLYVYENKALLKGDWWVSVFQPVQGNYHPITQASLWLDYQLGGLNPQIFHLSSLLWHILAVALAGRLALKVSGNKSLAFFVAMGFGIHPLHVESFAWISSRKDLIYSVAAIGSLLYWIHYLEKKSWISLGSCLLLFLAALLSKPMAVILPGLMALFLIYPAGTWLNPGKCQLGWKQLIVPALSLIPSLILAYLTYKAQFSVGAVRDIPSLGFWENTQIATHGFWFYLIKGIVPISLSAFYPYPPVWGGLPAIFLISFIFSILVIGVWVKWYRVLHPITPGMLWFLICLLPVLQFIPAGSALVAERYFYLAAFGFLLMLGCVLDRVVLNKLIRNGIMAGFLSLWAILAFQRVPIWKNGETLFRNVLVQFPNNPTAANNLGNWLEKNGQRKESCLWYERAVQSKPDFPQALFNLALCRQEQGNLIEARNLNLASLQRKPDFADAWNNLATIYGASGNLDSARIALDYALKLKPDYAAAWNNLGMYYLANGQKDSARISFEQSIAFDRSPNSDAARNLQYLKSGH
jgi:tetratricopeptide (TPR) repeat protein